MIKPEIFLLGFIDKKLEKKYGKLKLNTLTVAILLFAKKNCKNDEMHNMEEWIIKLIELAEMAKLPSLVKEKNNTVLKDWNPYMNFLKKEEKK